MYKKTEHAMSWTGVCQTLDRLDDQSTNQSEGENVLTEQSQIPGLRDIHQINSGQIVQLPDEALR